MQNDMEDENYIYMDKCVLTYGAQISSWLVSEIPPLEKITESVSSRSHFCAKEQSYILGHFWPKATQNDLK